MDIIFISVENDGFNVPETIAKKSGYVSNAINFGSREINEGFQTNMTTEHLNYFIDLLSIEPFNRDTILNKFTIDRKLLSDLFELERAAEYYQLPELQSVLFEAIYEYISGPTYAGQIDKSIVQYLQNNFEAKCQKQIPKGSYITFFVASKTGERADKEYINVVLFTHITFAEAKLHLAKYLVAGYARKASTYRLGQWNNRGQWNNPLELFNIEMRSDLPLITDEIINELKNLADGTNVSADIIFDRMIQLHIAIIPYNNANMFTVTDINKNIFLDHVYAENTGVEYGESNINWDSVYIAYIPYGDKIQNIDIRNINQLTHPVVPREFDRFEVEGFELEGFQIPLFREKETRILFIGSQNNPNVPTYAYVGTTSDGRTRILSQEERDLITSWGYLMIYFLSS